MLLHCPLDVDPLLPLVDGARASSLLSGLRLSILCLGSLAFLLLLCRLLLGGSLSGLLLCLLLGSLLCLGLTGERSLLLRRNAGGFLLLEPSSFGSRSGELLGKLALRLLDGSVDVLLVSS